MTGDIEDSEMNELQLVIETPRAGKWNHRFIAAKDGSLSESEVTKIIAAARRNSQGDNYMAVSSETAQSVSGRTGKEILVLVGVDVKQLSDIERQQIIEQLQQRLADVATLVTETIDWNKDGKELLLRRPELSDWTKEFSGLPKFSNPEKKSSLPKKYASKLKFVGGVVGILVVLVIGIWVYTFGLFEKQNIPPAEELTDETGNPGTPEQQNVIMHDNPDPFQEKFEKLQKDIADKPINHCDDLCTKSSFSKDISSVCNVLKNIKEYSNTEEFLKKLEDEKQTAAREMCITIDNLNLCLNSEHQVYQLIESYINFVNQLSTNQKETLCR